MQQQWHLAQHILAVNAAAHQAPGAEVEVRDVVQLPPTRGLKEGGVGVTAALEVAKDKDNDVHQLRTLEIHQTEVSFMVLSHFCYMIMMTTTILQTIHCLMMRAATLRATMRVTETLTTSTICMHKSCLTSELKTC